jgi:putative ABC transport system permease protein
VQGVPVEGRITSLREVRWNSFQPNFFVTFQPGVLEEAPKIFLASVPQLPAGEREALQGSIAEAFPNISAVDVTQAVQRLLGLLSQLHWAIASTALLSLFVGLVLVLAIARDQAHARRWETNLLKVLGADLRAIRTSLDVEFGALGLLAALAGALAGLLASALLARSVLHVDWSPALAPLAATALAIPALCVATARAAARRALRERRLLLLQAPEG